VNDTPQDSKSFRRTLIRVMSVQVVTLLILWWLQVTFTQ